MKEKIKKQVKYFLITLSILAVVIVVMSVFGLIPEQDPFPDDARIRITATGEEATVAFACLVRTRHGECRSNRNMAVTEEDDYWFLRFRGENNIDTGWNNAIYIRWRDFEIIDDGYGQE